jgi:hypothetical protein
MLTRDLVKMFVDANMEKMNTREKKMGKDVLAKLIASRITQGWSFTGQSREDHNQEVILITEEVYSRFGLEV